MIKLENQLKSIKKGLGKPRFMDYISEEPSFIETCFELFMSLLMCAISLVLWYVVYLDWENFEVLFCAFFLSMSWFTLYDVYKSCAYKTFAFIGDRGIAILEVKQRDKTVVKAGDLFFSQIDKVIIDTERHWGPGVGGKWVEYIKIKNGRKTFLKIDANHSQHYEKFKKVLCRYHQVYIVCRKPSE